MRVATFALLILTKLSACRSCGVVTARVYGHAVTFRNSPTVVAETPTSGSRLHPQATQRQLTRGNAFGFVSHRALLSRCAPQSPKRMRPEPRQYTVADLERAQDRVAAAERRIDNDPMSNSRRGRAGLKRAQRELSVIESQLRSRGLLE